MEKQKTMADLLPGEKGTVRGLKAKSGMRRRLQDLGLIEGTKIACVGQSPLGDPRCFLIRGAAIAIREADCEAVVVEAETRRKKNNRAGRKSERRKIDALQCADRAAPAYGKLGRQDGRKRFRYLRKSRDCVSNRGSPRHLLTADTLRGGSSRAGFFVL